MCFLSFVLKETVCRQLKGENNLDPGAQARSAVSFWLYSCLTHFALCMHTCVVVGYNHGKRCIVCHPKRYVSGNAVMIIRSTENCKNKTMQFTEKQPKSMELIDQMCFQAFWPTSQFSFLCISASITGADGLHDIMAYMFPADFTIKKTIVCVSVCVMNRKTDFCQQRQCGKLHHPSQQKYQFTAGKLLLQTLAIITHQANLCN